MISLRTLTCGLLLALPCLAQTESVTPHRVSFIREGMSEAEVVKRLGVPQSRTVLLRYTTVRPLRGMLFSSTHEQVALQYRDEAQHTKMVITVDKGRVTRTEMKME
ncbi:MAG: hypothetical protein AB7N91_19545 [Candidatus Tectimicrobiota bacterium]